MQIIELLLDEEQTTTGIDAISIVQNPAIESNFIALNKPKEIKFATIDEDKRLLIGPALIPNKPIHRKQDGMEFYCYFSRGTIKRASELYLERGNQKQATLEHAIKVQGICLVESWIKEDMEKDKSALYGMNDAVGTWMVTLKVDNEKVWTDYVKTGLVKGFSIEGWFADRSNMTIPKVEQSVPDRHDFMVAELMQIMTEYQNATK
jgi:hypothetical protein